MAEAGARTLTILVVEDDPMLANLVREVLNGVPKWGAVIVHDGVAAREVLRHVAVDLLVLDVNLPHLSGLDLLTVVRTERRWRDLPVILMSANPDQRGIEDAVQRSDLTWFLAKPFDLDELDELVHMATTAEAPGDQQAVWLEERRATPTT